MDFSSKNKHLDRAICKKKKKKSSETFKFYIHEFIDQNFSHVQYSKFDEAVEMVYKLGKGALWRRQT